MSSIVTRFAPSPTGMLHIGGVRTALMNWLFSRHHGGKYLVRIEDTDHARSTPEALAEITEGLAWLDLLGDGGIVRQSTRADRHRAVAEDLLANGHAYRCNCSAETLEAMRQEARAAGRTRVYDRRCRTASVPADQPHVVRLKAPTDGQTRIDDLVQGTVEVSNDHLDDFILLRADQTPTYMLSCVVDDADMAISHILRGDDHLNNAVRQLQLIRAAGFPEPRYGHISLLHGSDGSKLSKRHGALGVRHYREAGYLPEALGNYLMRLGWGVGEEILSRDDAARIFDPSQLSKAPARLDFDRLDHFNSVYLRQTPAKDLLDALERFNDTSCPEQPTALRALPILTPRAKTLIDLAEGLTPFVTPPVWPLTDAKAATQFANKHTGADLAGLCQRLENADFRDPEPLKIVIQAHVTALETGFGNVGQPLRIALTGTMQAPDVADILTILGKDESLNRIKTALEAVK